MPCIRGRYQAPLMMKQILHLHLHLILKGEASQAKSCGAADRMIRRMIRTGLCQKGVKAPACKSVKDDIIDPLGGKRCKLKNKSLSCTMLHWSIAAHAQARRKSVACAVEGADAPRTSRQERRGVLEKEI